jgi:hypothetical protein
MDDQLFLFAGAAGLLALLIDRIAAGLDRRSARRNFSQDP